MSEPFIAQVQIFPYNFAPRGWAFCNGQLLPIAQNTALFSLVGTTYGGDGRTTLGLPNLQGRAAMHPGSGPGLTPRRLGQSGGTATETLTTAQMANHTHMWQTSDETGDRTEPAGRYFGKGTALYAAPNNVGGMSGSMVTPAGGGHEHENMEPYQVLSYCIALAGIYPSRS